MNAALLIHAIVRQTTVLIAALATASGQRAQLASVANLVFAEQIGDHGFYFCVPQDGAAQASIDEGKIVLCTSADFEPLCSNDRGDLSPCSCMATNGDPRCSPAYCHCDSQDCDADLHFLRRQFDLTVVGERMSGTWMEFEVLTKLPLVLDRVNP